MFAYSSCYHQIMAMKSSTEKKGEVEKKRVKDVRGEYDSLASLLGLCQKRLNKAAILEAAVKFIQKYHEGLDIPMVVWNKPKGAAVSMLFFFRFQICLQIHLGDQT